MNPYLARKLTDQRMRDIRRAMHEGRPHSARHRPRNRSVRHRAGWTLVTIGLRLAATTDDA